MNLPASRNYFRGGAMLLTAVTCALPARAQTLIPPDLGADGAAPPVYRISVSPVIAYDSRWNGTAYGATGSSAYISGVNGIIDTTAAWESSYDTIWGQAGVDLHFETTRTLDTQSVTGAPPINPLNFQSGAQELAYFNGTNASLEGIIGGYTSSTGSAETHVVLYTNSYSNGTPVNTGPFPSTNPLNGGLSGFSASGVAVVPAPGTVANMRTIFTTGDGVTAENAANFNNLSVLPTVLAHEIGHNLSLDHSNTEAASEHYDPTRLDLLMATGAGTGTANVLSAGEVADALRTADINGTLSVNSGQTGTFWDTNGAAAGYGGNGTWGAADSVFGRPDGTGASGAWAGNQVAVFRAGGNYTVNVTGAQNVTGIAVQAGNAVFSGDGGIVLDNTTTGIGGVPEIFVESSRTAEFQVPLSGGGTEGLHKTGRGTAWLSHTDNSYTGGTVVRNGRLIGNAESIRGDVTLFNHSNDTLDSVLEFAAQDHTGAASSGIFSGNISGDGRVEINRSTTAAIPGILTMDGVWSHSGGTQLLDGKFTANGTLNTAGDFTADAGSVLAGDGAITAPVITLNGSLFEDYSLSSGGSGAADAFTESLTLNSPQIVLGDFFEAFFGLSSNTAYDQVITPGTLDFSGDHAISLYLLAGFIPAEGDAFQLFDAGAISGELPAFTLPALPGELAWSTGAFLSSGALSVVPEPAAGLFVLSGATLLMLRRRRKAEGAACFS